MHIICIDNSYLKVKLFWKINFRGASTTVKLAGLSELNVSRTILKIINVSFIVSFVFLANTASVSIFIFIYLFIYFKYLYLSTQLSHTFLPASTQSIFVCISLLSYRLSLSLLPNTLCSSPLHCRRSLLLPI